MTVFDSTVVAVETDAGITGYGEVCPLGPAYLPAYAAGARTGIAELGPSLLGLDPTETKRYQSAHGPCHAWSSLCKVCTGHGLLGHSR